MFFKKAKAQDSDPFAEYDPENQLRPKIAKADFFRTTGFDFGWLLLEPIAIVDSRSEEPELSKRFSQGQKALYFWWYLDAQVTNGGFVQFYYNDYEIYVPAIIKRLEAIGDQEMADLVKSAHKIYLSNKKIMDRAKQKDLFGSDLYERLEELSELDEEYYDIHENTMAILEKYARQNPNEFCVDELGQPFDTSFSGTLSTKYSNGELKEEFQLSNGVINGFLKTYFENGQIKSWNEFVDGEQVGVQKEWYENGNQKKVVTINAKTGNIREQLYYDNGQLEEEYTSDKNSQRIGKWLKFWKDGNKKLEAEFKGGAVYFQNYWNEEGEHLLVGGNGLYVNEYSIFEGQLQRDEQEYKNYKRDGKQWSYTNGILTLYQEMKDGKEHGITRVYDDDGNLKEEKLYENGRPVKK
jgi:antitoxin component YwqK of YwqJK toxin-antitoxin module